MHIKGQIFLEVQKKLKHFPTLFDVTYLLSSKKLGDVSKIFEAFSEAFSEYLTLPRMQQQKLFELIVSPSQISTAVL